jgi:hypothetical protein
MGTYENGQNVFERSVRLINEISIEIVRLLAYFRDLQGRVAIESATQTIKAALEERILFLGRFEPVKGPPLHKSATSVVIKALHRGAEKQYRKAFEETLNKKEESRNDHRSSVGKEDTTSLLNMLDVPWDRKLFKREFEKWDLDKDGRILEKSALSCSKVFSIMGDPARSF